MKRTLLLVILVMGFLGTTLYAQSDTTTVILPDDAPVELIDEPTMDEEEAFISDAMTDKKAIFGYNKEQTSVRPINTERWREATQGFDYSKDVPEPVEKVKEKPQKQYNGPDWNWNFERWGDVAKILSSVLLLGILGWLLYQFMQTPADSVIRAEDGTAITIDNLDAYIQETDLERFLREALSNNNYSQAVRIYYLQMIKDLSQKGAIEWSREKTNRDYLREMRHHPQFQGFRANTRTYEEVWYGNGTLDRDLFERIEVRMKRFLAAI
jgi:hypothetical protein